MNVSRYKRYIRRISYAVIASIAVMLLLAGCSGKKEARKFDVTVAQDGSGDFLTINDALKSVKFNKDPVTIYIKNGTYKEYIRIDKAMPPITFVGEDKSKTKISGDDYNNKPGPFGIKITEAERFSTVYVQEDNFTAENLTFENTAGAVGQALAFYTKGDKGIYKNCRFTGYQDTLRPESGRHYFENCYIEGTTDYIYGSGTAVFNKCTIYNNGGSVGEQKKGGYITAASTPQGTRFGFVFLDCKLDGNSPEGQTYLGRPWRAYANVAYIRCTMGKHIRPEGWFNWNDPEKEKTAIYLEYGSKGPGANSDTRVKWSKQLTEDEAKEYTVENILKGNDNWNPKK